jgi:hypothetical protein
LTTVVSQRSPKWWAGGLAPRPPGTVGPPHLGIVGRPAGQRGERDELRDEHVAVSLDALEAPPGEQQRLPADECPVPVVYGRRDDQVYLPVLVLDQHEDDAAGRRRALSRDREAGHRHPGPVGRAFQVGAREHLAGQVRPEELERVEADREAREAVVGEHPLPGRLLGQVGHLARRLEREGELPALSPVPGADRARREPEAPEELPARPAEGVAAPTRDERLERGPVERRAEREIGHARERPSRPTLLDERRRRLLPEPLHVADPHAHRAVLEPALDLAQVHVGGQHLDAAPLRVADEARRRVEAHRLRVEEGAEELARIVVAQPR